MRTIDTQRGGAVAVLLWTLVLLLALAALAAVGFWHAMQALDGLGGWRVVIDGRDVLEGWRWSDWNADEQVGIALFVGFVGVMLLVMVPLVVACGLLAVLALTALSIVVALAPVLLPVLLIVWLVRRASATRRPSAP